MIFDTLAKGANYRRLLFLPAVLCCWLVPHDTITAQDLNLNQAIDLALRQHPDLPVFNARQQQLQGARQTAALKPALEMELEVENFAGSNNFKSFDSAETTVALSSVIELGNQRNSRIAAADAREQQLNVERQIQALEVMAETTRRFVNSLTAQAHHELALEAEALAENALQTVQRRVKEGASPRAEALRAEAALAQARLTIAQAASEVEIAKLQLARMWAGDPAAFDSVSGDLLQLPQPQSQQAFVNRLENNAHMQRLVNGIAIRRAELKLAKANGNTDVRWRVGVKQFQQDDQNALVAGLSVPLFSGRRNRGEIIEAEAKLTEAQVQRQAAQLELRTHLLTLLTANQTHYEKVRQLRNHVIPLLQQAQADAQVAYRRGLYSYLELVAAQQDLIQARRNLIDTAAEALGLQADIEQLTAAPMTLPGYSSGEPTNNYPALAPEVNQ